MIKNSSLSGGYGGAKIKLVVLTFGFSSFSVEEPPRLKWNPLSMSKNLNMVVKHLGGMISPRDMYTNELHTGAASAPLPGRSLVAACNVAMKPCVEVMSMVLSYRTSNPKAFLPSWRRTKKKPKYKPNLSMWQIKYTKPFH